MAAENADWYQSTLVAYPAEKQAQEEEGSLV
jgi:hypothetical protein